MVERAAHLKRVERLLRQFPVVAIVGARQVGKTTVAREVAGRRRGPAHHFDLESDADRARLQEPVLALGALRGLVVLDEIQHVPDLFRTLRVLSDRPRSSARFLVLGSASADLLRQSSESLAGRIAYHELGGFDGSELPSERHPRLWLRGGFPRSYLARSHRESFEWREAFIRMFLERDLAQLGIRTPATTMRRFWTMLAHYHGQLFNASELARALGSNHNSVRKYLDALTATFVVLQLQPWHANLKKRQVKAPKVYLTDPGLLHALLGIRDQQALEGHPKVGASWEGFMISEVLSALSLGPQDAYFWATHAGAELDLLVPRPSGRHGFEIKRTSSPKVTPSMRIALEDLGLDHLHVVHAGEHRFPLAERITAVPAGELRAYLGAL